MPGKTNSDAIRDLEREVAKIGERSDYDRRDFARIDAVIAKVAEDFDDLRVRIAVLEARQIDLKNTKDEKDRRRWMVWMAVIGSMLTLAANIALTVWKR